MAANYATEVKLFGRWSFEDVECKDISLEDYIACKPKYAQFLPHSQGRWQKKRFRKAACPIVERMVCSMMRYGRNNGKKVMAVRIVKHAFEIIYLLTDQNPVQVFVEAVINCGPREDSTRVGGGGAVRRQACDVSPLRRVNQSIYLITTGAREASFRNIKTIAECLADEIMNAAKVRHRPATPPTAQPGRLRAAAATPSRDRGGRAGRVQLRAAEALAQRWRGGSLPLDSGLLRLPVAAPQLGLCQTLTLAGGKSRMGWRGGTRVGGAAAA